MKYPDDFLNKILLGDCLDVMKKIPNDSIDLISTDPPYGYNFMGKDWDKAVPSVDIWRECFRVLKSGAFMFVMSSPRQDVLSEMIVRLRTAGFRTDFPSIYWTYSQGFPKASSIALGIDKKFGIKRRVVGTSDKGCGNKEGTEHKEKGFASARDKEYEVTEATSPEAKAFEGAYGGYQPKPAVEIIIVVMKPLSEKGFTNQALKNGKGITWLEEGRIPYEDEKDKESARFGTQGDFTGGNWGAKEACKPREVIGHDRLASETGRWSPHLLVDDDVLNDGTVSQSRSQLMKPDKEESMFGKWKHNEIEIRGHDDSGSFSRFFDLNRWWEKKLESLPNKVQIVFPFMIVPKPASSEKNKGTENLDNLAYLDESRHDKTAIGCNNPRNRSGRARKGNIHATVKPIKLFSYLISLGSQKGDLILDPFAGSGTTCLAARLLERKYIGIDLNGDYCKVAEARLNDLDKRGVLTTFFES